MSSFTRHIRKTGSTFISAVDFLQPLALLVPRCVVAYVFFISARLKLPEGFLGVGLGDWQSTLFLFEYEYPVPGLSPQVAAYMGTTLELLCPILLVLGLGSRVAALALIGMVAVIEFTYQHSMDHVYWASLLVIILSAGPGKLSIDTWIRQRFFIK